MQPEGAAQLSNLSDGCLDVVDAEVGHDLAGVVAWVQPGSPLNHCIVALT